MSKVHFISDLHLGHASICNFSGELRGNSKTVEEHDNYIIESWNSVVTKQDLVYVLGDVCLHKNSLAKIWKLKGSKHLILGNHDEFSLNEYLKYFNKVHGFMKYKGSAWLSHAPIHPGSLRNKFNIHGHVHQNSVDDLRYINVSVEALNGKPVSWEMIQTIMEDRRALIKLNDKLSE